MRSWARRAISGTLSGTCSWRSWGRRPRCWSSPASTTAGSRDSRRHAMSEHKAAVRWKLEGDGFLKGRYSREHTWTFDGGLTVPASPSPGVVPVPWSNPANVDPEEAYVAAISSCHMLTFLYVAYRAGFEVESYEDEAVGVMTKNDKGVPWISAVTLKPRI